MLGQLPKHQERMFLSSLCGASPVALALGHVAQTLQILNLSPMTRATHIWVGGDQFIFLTSGTSVGVILSMLRPHWPLPQRLLNLSIPYSR